MSRRSRSEAICLFVLMISVNLHLTGCLQDSESARIDRSAQIRITPDENVDFPSAYIDFAELDPVEQVVISNQGAGPLKILAVALHEEDPVAEFTLLRQPPGASPAPVAAGTPSACPAVEPFVLPGVGDGDREDAAAGSSCVLWLRYSPRDTLPDQGWLEIRSNDSLAPVRRLRLAAERVVPELNVTPRRLVFPDTPPGTTVWQDLTVFNGGTAPLTIEGLTLVDDGGAFSLEPLAHAALPYLLPAAPAIAPRRSFTVRVAYSPRTPGTSAGVLRIDSDDPDARQLEVPLVGGSPRRCLEILPESVDFGEVALGTRAEQGLELVNCGDSPVVVTGLRLDEQGTSPDFSLLEAAAGLACAGDPARACAGELLLPAGARTAVGLAYLPGSEGPDGGQLMVLSDVPGQEEQAVPLFGLGTTNSCPQAHAQARLAGAEVWEQFPDPEHRLEAPPLATLELSGAGSHDPDGDALVHRWSVRTRPGGSTAALTPHEAVASPTFFLDLAGEYVFELEVVDQRGLPSCRVAQVFVLCRPRSAIHVQLVWDTPADPDQTDTGYAAGSDLDLHLLHPLGDWFDRPADCYYANPAPDWGRPGQAAGDPTLDIDDLDGAGPENINLDEPERGRLYRVGVHYFADHGYGVSFATVRVFLDGLLAAELLHRRLPTTDAFWDVGVVDWGSRTVQIVDEVSNLAAPRED
ncbi:MAG: choice-of-anchor D domain-containing protein [Myxococcota bacterium]|jgi:hypothetical protein|nr:choice-of-anchor D domain-containing protein [Myxococcota bacterium]